MGSHVESYPGIRLYNARNVAAAVSFSLAVLCLIVLVPAGPSVAQAPPSIAAPALYFQRTRPDWESMPTKSPALVPMKRFVTGLS